MSKSPKPPFDLPPSDEAIDDPLAREALAWLSHLHSGEDKLEDWIAFDQWQATSAEHQRAADKARRMWEQIGSSLHVGRKPPTKLQIILVAAIGFGALGFLGGFFGPPASFFADYKSATGEVRSVVLRDGSEVELDTGTSFDVSDSDRTITLYTGQVFVRVAPSPDRPFIIVAGNAKAQALGTAFGVRRDTGRAMVLVSESSVQVSDTRPAGSRSVRLGAGNAVTLSRDTGLGQPSPADIDALTAWRRGELAFTHRPLGEVVAELDRYRVGKLLIIGGSIRELPVTGSVDIRKLDQFLESLEVVLPVKVVKIPGFATIMPHPGR